MNTAAEHKYILEPTAKQAFKLALPIALSILVPQINFITNNIFLGHLNLDALGVAGITGVYYLIFAVMGNGLVNGLQSIISRRSGANRIHEIGGIYQHGLILALVIALSGIIITLIFAAPILSLTLRDEEHVQMCVSFLKQRIWGLPLLYLFQVNNVLLISTNKSKLILFGSVSETFSNILFDYCLIFGHFGFAAMGFDGAAVASVISEGIGASTVIIVIIFSGTYKPFQLWQKLQFSFESIRTILNQSLPLIAQYTISIISWEFFYILIEHHGKLALSVSNVMRNLFGLFGCLTWGFASASNTMVSNLIGQGKQDKVLPLVKLLIKLSLGVTGIFVLLLNLAPGILMRAYGQDETFIAAAIPVARIISVGLLIMSVGTVLMNAVVGTGNSKFNLLTELLAISIYVIYVYVVLEVFNLNIIIGWMSEWLYWTCLLLPSLWYMRSMRWKGKVF